jgi:hypothetical protein
MASSHFIHMSRYVKYPPVVKHSFFFHSPDEWWFTGSSPKTGFGSFGAAIPECQEIRISRLSELERSTIFKNGKPSINIPWLPWLCLITRGYIYIYIILPHTTSGNVTWFHLKPHVFHRKHNVFLTPDSRILQPS